MSFDGIFTHLIVHELNEELENGRLSKIHQPYPNEIVLVIRGKGKNHKILLSAHPSYARIQKTDMQYENPSSPPTFCMILRKHLEGAVLEDITQVENDRIIHFRFRGYDEIGDSRNVKLVIELMGRHSNILLIDENNDRIMDCIKHVPMSQNRFRSLTPGATYQAPPKQESLNPFVDDFDLAQLDMELPLEKAIQKAYQGIGMDTAIELVTLAEQDPALLATIFNQFMSRMKENQIAPTMTIGAKKSYFTPIPFKSLAGELTEFNSLSELLDGYYAGKADRDRVQQQGSELIRFVQNELQRNIKKLKKLEQTLDETEKADSYRIKGEILTAYLHEIEKGMTEITLDNFYQDNEPIKIALDNRKNPSQNAQKYFVKYQKLRNAIDFVEEQMRLTQAEIDYLESVTTQIQLAAPKDLEAIKEELQSEGYLKKQQRKHKNKQPIASKPEKYRSSDGTEILVGRNNLQNDLLTLKIARKTDTWLHAKNIPGSHVIIQSNQPSEETIAEAAMLAAYFSKYQLSASVPVDYVAVKQVKKPNGAKPGFVIYEGQKTIHVTPNPELVKQLKVT